MNSKLKKLQATNRGNIMTTQYTFIAGFYDSNLNDFDVNYQMTEDNCDRWEALIYCWKEVIQQHCHPENVPAVLKIFNIKLRSVPNFHALNDLTLRIKDKNSRGTTLKCSGTNHYGIGCEISA